VALGWFMIMGFNATFNNISIISWWSFLLGGGNRSTRRKLPTCHRSLANFITCCIEHNSPRVGFESPFYKATPTKDHLLIRPDFRCSGLVK